MENLFNNPYGSEMMTILIIVLLGLLFLYLIPKIFYLLTLQNTLKKISIENRKMPPGQVWLNLIPLFSLVWQFITVSAIADSLKTEFAKRNLTVTEDRPGYSMGLIYCILNCCTIVPILGALAGIGAFVCWIMYWIKIHDYKSKLKVSDTVLDAL